MSLNLRPYQADAVTALRESFRSGKRAPLLVLPTGGGKTQCFAFMTHGASAKGKRVLILAHRKELIKQASRKLSEAGVEHGIISPGFTKTRDAVQVASVQTICRKPTEYGAFDLIVIDEAHHTVAGQYIAIIAAQPSAKLLGVTATPERGDSRGLGISAGGVFDDIVIGPTVAELIAGEFLTPVRVFAPATGPDLSGVRIKMGDYEKAGLAAVMNVPTLTGEATSHYAKHAGGKPAIAFCVSVDHAKSTAAAFRAAGFRSVAADGSMPPAERDAAIGGLADGRVQVLCSCSLIDEGLDVPAVAAVLLLNPTRSLGRYLQQVGRGLRPAPGKSHLVVLDHAGSTLAHGMPDGDREWSLDGRPKKQQAAALKQCPTCFAIFSPAAACPECGHSFAAEIKEARELEVIAGELEEINQARLDMMRKTPLDKLLTGRESWAQLEEIRKARKYHPRWSHHQMQRRKERRSAAA